MKTQLMEKFYRYIKEGENFEEVKKLRVALNELFDELPDYLVQKIHEKYESKVSEWTAFQTVEMIQESTCLFRQFQNTTCQSTVLEIVAKRDDRMGHFLMIGLYDESFYKGEAPIAIQSILHKTGYLDQFSLFPHRPEDSDPIGKWYVYNRKFKVLESLDEYEDMLIFLADFHKKLREVFVNTEN